MVDAYFKNHFWTFILGTVLVASFLAAKTTNIVVAYGIRPGAEAIQPSRSKNAQTTAGTQQANTAPITAFLDKNLFNADRDLPKPKAVASKPKAPTPKPQRFDEVCDASCAKPTIQATLVATFWSENREAAAASFQTKAGETHIVRINDELLGGVVMEVQRGNVCIRKSGRCEIFSLAGAHPQKRRPATVAKRPPPPPKSNRPPVKSNLGKGIRKLSDKQYEIPRATIDNVLSNLNQIARQARIIPAFKDGKAIGFKLFSIRQGSLYSSIGIENSDIIRKINGHEINSPEKAFQIYSKLKNAGTITVDLERRGQPRSMKYNIKQ